MYKLCFYVPTTHVEQVKNALFAKGAGRIGDYAACCWQVLGEGQFMPLEASQPFIGEAGQISKVEEFKVELVCEASLIHEVVAELRRAHPYEEPAFQVWRIEEF